MVSFSNDARQAAKRIRYARDSLNIGRSSFDLRRTRDALLIGGVRCSASLTPLVEEALAKVCDRLLLPRSCVDAYVYSGLSVQADCIIVSDHECIVRLSSGLINLLTSDELEFVIGHEIAHFLFDHAPTSGSSVEAFVLQRSQEISADRLGYVACGSLDCTMRAFMKTASGLQAPHLRFNVAEFLGQLRQLSKVHTAALDATHPALIVRSRAINWFALAFPASEYHIASTDALRAIDERIYKDLDAFVDGPAREVIEECKSNVFLWCCVEQLVTKGRFTRVAQDKIAGIFGVNTMNSVRSLLLGNEREGALQIVSEKLHAAIDKLKETAPHSFPRLITEVRERSRAIAVDF